MESSVWGALPLSSMPQSAWYGPADPPIPPNRHFRAGRQTFCVPCAGVAAFNSGLLSPPQGLRHPFSNLGWLTLAWAAAALLMHSSIRCCDTCEVGNQAPS